MTLIRLVKSVGARIGARAASTEGHRRAMLLASAALALGCGTLAISSTALAKSGGAANEGLAASSYHWRATVDGSPYVVAAGGQLAYCASDTVERLMVIAHLSARGDGEHRYVVRLFGPKDAGGTFTVEKVVTGRHATLELGFSPLSFPELTRESNRPAFVPGTYRVQLVSIVGRELHKRKVTLGGKAEHISLAPKSGC